MDNHPLDNRCMVYIILHHMGTPTTPLPHGDPRSLHHIDLFKLVHLGPPLPVNRQSDMTENIALPKTTYAGGNKIEIFGPWNTKFYLLRFWHLIVWASNGMSM